MNEPFPLEAFLARLACDGPVAPRPEILTAWHQAHVLAVPFENLDPLGGRPNSLEPADLTAKILRRRRGGYCFELNELFRLALEAAGFRTRALCGRVHLGDGRYALRGHQVTLVECAGRRWLADVGFGGNGLLRPLPLEPGRVEAQELDVYRLVEDPEYGLRLEHEVAGRWRPLYAFSLDRFLPIDFHVLNEFVSRSPASMFTRVPICVRATLAERRIVTANQFKVRAADGSCVTRELRSSADLRGVLTAELGIPLPPDFPLPEPTPAPPGMREL